MSVPTLHTIILKGLEKGIEVEGVAGVAITPGMLIELYQTGGVLKLRPHTTAIGSNMRMFARENSLVGKDPSFGYSIGDYVQAMALPRGSDVYAVVAAGAPAITMGDFLESAGDGTLRKHVVTDDVDPALYGTGIVGQAIDTLDNSGGGSAVNIRVKIW